MRHLITCCLFFSALHAETPIKKSLLEDLCKNKKTQIALLPHASKEWFKAAQELVELEHAYTSCHIELRPYLLAPEQLPLHLLARHPTLKEQLIDLESLASKHHISLNTYYPDIDLYTLLDADTLTLAELSSHTAPPSPFFAPTTPQPMDTDHILEWERALFYYHNHLLTTIKQTLIPLSTLRSLVEQKRIHAHLIETARNHHTLCFFRFSQGKLDYLAVLEAEQDLLQERLLECDLYNEEQLALMDISYLLENR